MATRESLLHTDGGHLIDTDQVRELSPAYRDNRLRAADIHEAASALTKQLYARALARPVAEGRDNAVLFMADGKVVDHLERPTAEAVFDRMKTMGR